MALHEIKQGLNLPIKGQPLQEIQDGAQVSQVALLGHDYPNMKPRMHVQVGDVVKRGQLLFDDRKSEGVHFTSPSAGKVVAIHRGEKRVFQSLVIELSEQEKKGKRVDSEQIELVHYKKKKIKELQPDEVRALLQESGLWTSLRTRPFERVPALASECHSIFVKAIDTAPLAASVEKIVVGREKDLEAGLEVLSKLTSGKVFLCVGKDWTLDFPKVERLQKEVFVGQHPAGLVGTHIHLLAPVSRTRTVWHVGYQDVLAIGKLFLEGIIDSQRVISLAGPVVKKPRLLRTTLGASTQELTKAQLDETTETRTISGSVLFGQKASCEVFGFLNRYDLQISCVAEDKERVFLGWLQPGKDKFSTIRAYLSKWLPQKEETLFSFTTTTHGSHRAMVPIGMFERVMPLDILPTFLLRSLLVSDIEKSEQLGCLELHEEDLSLCSFVCPGKEDYGKALRSILTQIWQEG